ncbi:phenylalanine--tRNA ligase subunit beta [Chiayiivirga flava]|uniref:Phenylalanine--tRNA ligase beta subunit n=1 Tax=Chiayiivirga flava TaxID=659595 RepID=A0A7W8FZ98_9GAMM|nr:phenylalanine--tRNA ligase subunit beta [Chiayiivirga flava]MBB5208207.1 phenylalanyl-tRNA synthetase beta chain [Chiayiivirga flava]
MKFPESWLREHVTVDADRATLAATLTAIGLEVEAVNTIGSPLDGVIVAQIVACEKHPEADRLKLCRVDVGNGETVQIVCGAPNAREGLKAPLATVGTTMPGGLEIKPAKLRGVESFGMLCSAKELEIDPDASGLLELPADAPVGTSIAQYLGLPDASFELKLTPNRADCFSVRGVAFDVAAAFGSTVAPFPVAPVQAAIASERAIELDAGRDVPRFCGRIIEGIDPDAATPLWMRERLKRAGLRPISALVDVTNYVMLELGQPLHAFDNDALQGTVRVRRAKAGETLKLLDEREVTLDSDFLVVADDEGALALGGIMGGWDSRVTGRTRNVFLEAAHWAPDVIAGRARRLGMHTDASHRFERGVDPELPRVAVERASALILEIAGGRPGPLTEAAWKEHLRPHAPVLLRRQRLGRILGMEVPPDEVERILLALGMTVLADVEGWRVTPPSRRFDIAIEEDLIEEIARIRGYDAVPLHAPSGQIALAPMPEARVELADLRRQLCARGYFEAINYAFLDAGTLRTWSLDADAVALANPLSADLGVMRTSLLPGLVSALQRNRARQQERVRLFETGRVFARTADGLRETLRVAGVACGTAKAEQWNATRRGLDFHDVQGDVESLLGLSGANVNFRYVAASEPWLHPGRSAELWRGDVRVGVLGHLHPALAQALDIDGEVLAFELDAEALVERVLPRAADLSKYPSVRRDLAVVVAQDTPWSALEASLRAALGPLLREVRLFDQYRGTGLEPGFKSLAMGLILQDGYRTLHDADTDAAVQAALVALQHDCSARIRG